EANKLDAAARVLAATAQITGVNFEFLQASANKANEQFRLGPVLANQFTIELTKLTSKAGDLSKLGDGLAAFLDIGAARGLSAQQTLDAIGQAIIGIDEGTDKLFGANPSVLYKEYADRIGTTVGRLTDQQKALALVTAAQEAYNRVGNEYSRFLQTAEGQQQRLNNELEEAQLAF